jgi:nucleoside-diphosphate-sugar epimerase
MSSHAEWCEAESDHAYNCATATELARLRSFAEAVRDEFECDAPEAEVADPDHVQDCWHHAAADALRKPGP